MGIKPDTVYNDIITSLDWFPTLSAAAAAVDIQARLAKGIEANGKDGNVYLDGYNFMPYWL